MAEMQGHPLQRRHRWRAREERPEAEEHCPAGENGIAPRLATALRDAVALTEVPILRHPSGDTPDQEWPADCQGGDGSAQTASGSDPERV